MKVYTDGSCLKNPGGNGGWAYVILDETENEIAKDFEGVSVTSNNKMELSAVIKAFKYLINQNFSANKIELYSDSQYVLKGLNVWIHGWIKKGWKTSTGGDVLNKELWVELNELRNKLVNELQNEISFNWVKSHNGDKWNELVDVLANTAAQNVGNSIDENATPFDQDTKIMNKGYNSTGVINQNDMNLNVQDLINMLSEYSSDSKCLIEYGRIEIRKD